MTAWLWQQPQENTWFCIYTILIVACRFTSVCFYPLCILYHIAHWIICIHIPVNYTVSQKVCLIWMLHDCVYEQMFLVVEANHRIISMIIFVSSQVWAYVVVMFHNHKCLLCGHAVWLKHRVSFTCHMIIIRYDAVRYTVLYSSEGLVLKLLNNTDSCTRYFSNFK